MRGKFVGCCGGHVGVISTPKNFEMVIGGLGGIKVGVRCREGEGFSGELIHKICGSVWGLNPVNQRKTRLKQKGA
jgi:hypothetical protein